MTADGPNTTGQRINGAEPHLRHTADSGLRNLSLKTITGKASGRTANIFYGVVLTVALIGSGTAAAGWLGWKPWAAFTAVAAVEFGGVVLSMHADERRRLGERAIAARLLSGAFAAAAVAVNWFGHQHVGQAAFFAGVSALGYLVYLLISSAKRRDYLRAAHELDDPAPVYGAVQWVTHPWVTRRARTLALSNSVQRRTEGAHPTTPLLGRLGSLAAARAEIKAERRQKAIASALRGRIADRAGPVLADIAVHTYDVDEIARRLADQADYDGLTGLIAADLRPDRLAGPTDRETATTDQDDTNRSIDQGVEATTDQTTGRADQPTTTADHGTDRKPQPTTDQADRPVRRSTDHEPTTSRRRPATRPTASRPTTDQTGTGQPTNVQPLWSPAAVANAASLRERFGDQLPTTDRQTRDAMGWSHDRTVAAIRAYRAGADQHTGTDRPASTDQNRPTSDPTDQDTPTDRDVVGRVQVAAAV